MFVRRTSSLPLRNASSLVRLKALKYMTGETGGVFQLAKMVDPSVIGSFVRMIASIIGRIAMALKEPSTRDVHIQKLLTF